MAYSVESNQQQAIKEAQYIIDLLAESHPYYKNVKVIRVERSPQPLSATIFLDNDKTEHWSGLQAHRVLCYLG